MKTILLAFLFANPVFSADQAVLDRGKQEEARSCIPCHSLRIVHSQRLSRAAWNRELDKMINWGTKLGDRDAVLEYLVANFGDDKPLPQAGMSADGAVKK